MIGAEREKKRVLLRKESAVQPNTSARGRGKVEDDVARRLE